VDRAAFRSETAIFNTVVEGETIILTPVANLRELEFEEINVEAKAVLAMLSAGPARNVVVDFGHTDYFGSTALGFFTQLWQQVKRRNGRLAFCNVSPHEREILRVAGLDGLWPICASRPEALEAVRGRSPQ
jgi:anti-anti-sigma factor